MSSPNRCSPCHGDGFSWAADIHTQLSLLLPSTAIQRFNMFSLNTSVSRAWRVMVNLRFPGLLPSYGGALAGVLNLDFHEFN